MKRTGVNMNLWERLGVTRRMTKKQVLKRLGNLERYERQNRKAVKALAQKKGAKGYASRLLHQDKLESYFDAVAEIKLLKQKLRSLS